MSRNSLINDLLIGWIEKNFFLYRPRDFFHTSAFKSKNDLNTKINNEWFIILNK